MVEKSELRGYGHQLGNLMPCCRTCNSRKGATQWEAYLKRIDESNYERKRALIAQYLAQNAVEFDLKRAEQEHPEDWKRYIEIREQILKLMDDADRIADRLRRPPDGRPRA